MRRFRLILITALGALAVPLVAASGAQADVASCAFGGATGSIDSVTGTDVPAFPNEVGGGVESVLTDLADGNTGGGQLTDTDNGTGVDGGYTFSNSPGPPPGDPTKFGACVYVDSPGSPATASGLYTAVISSAGDYDNTVCGTGFAGDGATFSVVGLGAQGPAFVDKSTTVTLTAVQSIGAPAPPDVLDADYAIRFAAGEGVLDIDSIENPVGTNRLVNDDAAGQDAPEGFVNIAPTKTEGDLTTPPSPGKSCVSEDPTPADATNNAGSGDVKEFRAQGAFVVNLAGV